MQVALSVGDNHNDTLKGIKYSIGDSDLGHKALCGVLNWPQADVSLNRPQSALWGFE